MAYTPVKPTDPLDNPSHSGLHNQHATDLEALQAFRELFAGGDAGEVLAKTTNDDYDIEWLPGGTGGGGDGGDYPGISSEDPNGLGLGTDGGLRVEPADLLSDNEGQQLRVAADDGKLHMAYDIVDAVPEDDDTTYSIGDVVFVTGPGDGGSALPGVGGKVLQVVRAVDKTRLDITNTSYEPTPLSVTIQPQRPDSRIMIFATYTFSTYWTTETNQTAYVRIVNAAGAAIEGAEMTYHGSSNLNGTGTRQLLGTPTLIGYDTLSSADEQTYRLEARTGSSGNQLSLVNDKSTAQLIAMEVAA